jgi:multiple sugar transport system ATP-binding protein
MNLSAKLIAVAENLAFGLKLRKLPRAAIEQRVKAAAAKLGLAAVLDHRPGMLSGGQRQRVALGRAIVRDPKVFLLDEPLSNLDAKLRLTTRMEIARLQRSLGATMIYVTHDQIEAMTLGQRIVVLNGGAIQQIDTPMRLYERPANLFVAGFFGSPAMNFFQGILDRDGVLQLDDGIRLSIGDTQRSNPATSRYIDREIAIGLRPEDLAPLPNGSEYERTITLAARLEYVEPVGNEIFLNLRLGARDLVARTPPMRLPELGSTITLQFRAEKLHCFDPVSGARIES